MIAQGTRRFEYHGCLRNVSKGCAMKIPARVLRSVAAGVLLVVAGIPGALAQSEAKGWVVMSVSQDSGVGTILLVMRSFDDPGRSHEVGLTLSLFANDQHKWTESSIGAVRALQLPAGAYRLANFRIKEVVANRQWKARQDFSIPFTVTANEVTYLGEFLGTGVLGPSFLGVRAIEKPYFLVSDQRARDMPIAEKEQPEVRGLPVRSVAPLRSGAKGSNYFVTKRVRDPYPPTE